jgi:hypothetical protein
MKTRDAEKTRVDRNDGGPARPEHTVVEIPAAGRGEGTRAGGRLQEFHGWRVLESFPARGAEADIFLLGRETDRRVLKLYRLGVAPKDEVIERISTVTQKLPDAFVRVFEQGYDAVSRRAFEVQEFFPLGTYAEFLEAGKASVAHAETFVRQVAGALTIMHGAGILHLDLKPANLLIRAETPFQIAVTDFGIASLLGEEYSKKLTDVKGTSLYQSPESLSGIVSPKSDWWALGMMVLETLLGQHPFAGLPRQSVFYQLTTTDLQIPAAVPREWYPLVRGLLTRDPHQRWGEAQVQGWLQNRLASENGGAQEPVMEHGRASGNASGNAGKASGKGAVPAARPDGARGENAPAEPLEVGARSFPDLFSLLTAAAGSPELWSELLDPVRHNVFTGWLDRRSEYELSQKVFQVLGRGEAPEIGLFRLICRFCPQLGPAWNGMPLRQPFLEKVLQKAAGAEPDETDRRFLDLLFSGWIRETLEKERVTIDDETRGILHLIASLPKATLGAAPLTKRALILLAAITGAFARQRPLEQARRFAGREKETEWLFRVAATDGFLPWAREQGVIDDPAEILWRFLTACARDGFGPVTARLFEHLRGHEERLVIALSSREGFSGRLVKFVCGGEVTEEVFRFFLESRTELKWLEEFFLERFRLKPGAEFDTFCRRFLVLLKLKSQQDALRDRLLPPVLTGALEQGAKVGGNTAGLRQLLATSRLEGFEETLRDPGALLPKGIGQVQDWPGLVRLLERHLVPVPADLDARSLKVLQTLVLDLVRLEELRHPTWAQRSADEWWTWSGIALALVLSVTGLGTLPGGVAFIGIWWLQGREQRAWRNDLEKRITVGQAAMARGGGA